ncbi:HAD family hydrolase [Thermococcus sp.]|uniref:HAD family hydrolase n=1 Tax=Thermococcus sp. TaxID=35749 RepID=UPI002602CAF4|nr:HAD family hydrolase [Thermococcus sp.]
MLVLLDLDDTLCNTWGAGKRTILASIPTFLRKGKVRAVLYVLTGRFRELEGSEGAHLLDFEELVGLILRRVYGEIADEEVKEVSGKVEELFFRHLRLYPDAIPFLRGLKGLGARVVLITDSSTRWQRKKIEFLGIGDYLDGVVISGETGHSKLEDYNFRLALKKFPDDEVYVVGDRDETDMRGGKSIGATTILVKRGYYRSRKSSFADYVVGNLLEALEMIRHEHEKRA